MADAERCEGEVAELFALWNDALKTGRAEVVASLYATNGVLVPTLKNDIRTDRASIRDYFVGFLKDKPTAVLTECNPRRYSPTLIANSTHYPQVSARRGFAAGRG